jgi:ABC-type Mn2+/Zn2+ transport system ATPase subunit
MNAAIKIENLFFSYGDFQILKNINLHIPPKNFQLYSAKTVVVNRLFLRY